MAKRKRLPSIVDATRDYERWANSFTPLIKSEIDYKHKQMAADPVAFFRGTFYRWAQRFPKRFPELADAPALLAVGDLHLDNFGTWRDDEGRLAWGINDFDEAARLSYANDLVRLAASIKIALPKARFVTACAQILRGYTETIDAAVDGDKADVKPIVLAQGDEWLQKIAVRQLKSPPAFWHALEPQSEGSTTKSVARKNIPGIASRAVCRALPDGMGKLEWLSRTAGMGSLGRQRYVAIGEWKGGKIAREVKALVPSAVWWVAKDPQPPINVYDKIHDAAVRSPDPYLFAAYGWVVRRLAPDSHKLALSHLEPKELAPIFHAMGRDTANVHCGSRKRLADVKKHLDSLPEEWLLDAASTMADVMMKDFAAWREWQSSVIELPVGDEDVVTASAEDAA